MENLSLCALPLIVDEASGATDEQEGVPITLEEGSLGFDQYPFSDVQSNSDLDAEDSDGSETSHESSCNADECQEVTGIAKERKVQADLAQLRLAVSGGDEEAVERILQEKHIPDDPKSIFLAVRAGHHLVLRLHLEIGGFNSDPCVSLKGPANHFTTPMFAAIGQSNLQVVEVLAHANGFDPTRTRFDGKTYQEIARERGAPTGWKKRKS